MNKITLDETEDKIFRPEIYQRDRVKKLESEFGIAAVKIVNFFVDTGLEVFERSLPIIKEEIKKKIINKK